MPSVTQLRQRLKDDPRLARMLHGALSSVAGRGMAMIIGAISLPISVRYLGRTEYGVWVTISTTVAMLSALDLGIANTLTNLIAEAYAAADARRAALYYSTAFWLTVGVCAAIGAVAAGLWHSIPWAQLFNIGDAVLARRTQQCVAVSLTFFLVSMPLSLTNRVLIGYQKTQIANYFAMANSVLGLLGILTAILLHGTIVLMMLCLCIALLLGNAALKSYLLFFHAPRLRPHPGRVSWQVARGLFRQSSLFFALQITGLVVFNTDNLVITHYLGPEQVTAYSIAWRLTTYVALMQQMLVPSTWSAFAEAYQSQQMDWVQRSYRSLTRNTLAVTAVAAIGLGLLGQAVIRIWAGPHAMPSSILMWTMAAWAVVTCVTTNQSILLTATGRLGVEAGAAVAAAAANLAMSVYLVQRIGPEGVILATILSFLLLMLVPQEIEARRILKGRYLPRHLVPHNAVNAAGVENGA